MIVKSLPRKTRSFGQLLSYINEPEQAGRVLLHNLLAPENDLAAIEAELMGNSRLLSPRKNGNYLYHEILSFGVDDRGLVTPAILEDVTRSYLELRAPNALAYARAHLDAANPHVHLLISANNVGSSRRLRLSRQDFQQVKRKLERHQRERYPHLEHSVVFEKTKAPQKHHIQQRRRESERERRLQKSGTRSPSRKEEIQSIVLTQLTVAASGEDLYRNLKQQGLRLYRRGKSVAVEDTTSGCRYRLRTLGVDESFDTAMRQWKVVPERLRSIQKAQGIPAKQQLSRQRRPAYRDPPDHDLVP